MTPGFHKWRWRFVTAWLIVFTGLTAWNLHRNKTLSQENCAGIARLDVAISATLERSLRTIPTLRYYKQHPDERDRALAEIHRELRTFVPPDCH